MSALGKATPSERDASLKVCSTSEVPRQPVGEPSNF
jgi:hypothetical protein